MVKTREELAPPEIRERFEARFEVGPSCWVWRGTKQSRPGAYGVIQAGRMQFRAHRLAYFYAFGPIPAGLVVRHTCDNPLCVRPDHLRVGTQLQNNRDKVARDRQARGTRVNTARLTATQVRDLRKRMDAGESPSQLAREFGLGKTTVFHIKHRTSWRHV